jgi:hypothetical protein
MPGNLNAASISKSRNGGGSVEAYQPDWRVLCQAASREQDPDRLIILVEQLNRVLLQREIFRKQRLSTN